MIGLVHLDVSSERVGRNKVIQVFPGSIFRPFPPLSWPLFRGWWLRSYQQPAYQPMAYQPASYQQMAMPAAQPMTLGIPDTAHGQNHVFPSQLGQRFIVRNSPLPRLYLLQCFQIKELPKIRADKIHFSFERPHVLESSQRAVQDLPGCACLPASLHGGLSLPASDVPAGRH